MAEHDRGRCLLVLVNADGQVAHDLAGESHFAFHLRNRLVGGVQVHEGVVAFTVSLDAIREASESPVFGLANASTAGPDDVAVSLDESFGLLRGEIRAGYEYMFVEGHACSFDIDDKERPTLYQFCRAIKRKMRD